MCKRSCLCILILLALLGSCAGKPAEEQLSPLDRQVISLANLAKMGKSTGGLTITARKLSLKEIGEHLEMNEETTKLHLRSTNIHGYFSLKTNKFPPGLEFSLYQVNMARKVHLAKTFYSNEAGGLVTPIDDFTVNFENNFLFFASYLPGEPVDFVLLSRDGKYYAATRIVPNPIEATDNRRRISLSIDDPKRRSYIVHGTGFTPSEPYLLITTFEGEQLAFDLQADSKGEIFQKTGPSLPWITGGEGSLELRGGDLNEPLFVEFKWGL